MGNTNDDVIIVGSLDDKALKQSINELVEYVDRNTSEMASSFIVSMDMMKGAMKDFAITQKVSVDLMKQAWREMSKSFDAMVTAQQAQTDPKTGKPSEDIKTVKQLDALISYEEARRRNMELETQELVKQNERIAELKQYRKEELSTEEELLKAQEKRTAEMERRAKKALKENQESYKESLAQAQKLPTNNLVQVENKLKELKRVKDEMLASGLFKKSEIMAVEKEIDNLKTKIQKLKDSKPKSLKEVLGMDESSVDAIAKKMQALKRVSIDSKNAIQVKQLGNEYQRLSRLQAELLGKNIQLTHSNNYLAQSFGYIRNRIVYALTLGAITNFVKQLYEIRGQYELLERSLGVLVGSFENGTQIFNELNEMAIKSPFTLIELGTAAKQLTAYNFAANEVVDTTRRLADISSALGVPMERLTYNLGQIKAQGVLNARDARDFANAGLAIVPMLAKMYTEQKTFGNEMVTTAQVYDMMSKKMVTYSDVLKVLYRVTDEGGKFFDFQAKQADTLRVQMANLTLAYNNMLNEIGAKNQGVLSGMVGGLKTLLKNWREISRAILTLVTTLGTYKAVAAIVSALNSRMFVGSVLVGLRNYILSIKSATGAMATFNAVTKANPIAFLISALVAAIGYFALFNHKVKETTVEMERFGENASKQIKKVETLGKVLAGVEQGSSTYKKALSELNQTLSEYGITEIKNRDQINAKIQETIQLIKEEGKERQYANNIAKGEEKYINDTGQAKSSLNENLLGLEGWFGTTSKTRREILDNVEAITDVASSIIEENIGLIVNKTGQEAYDGLIEIKNRVRSGLKDSGLSNNAIDFILNKEYINAAIKDYRIAAEEHEKYNQKIKGYYDAATKATQSTMTFTEKVNANAMALRNNTEDALSLYNRIYDIVKIAKENHVINFDLKLSAEKPPKWMFDKSLPELQRLAERFTAIAQSGGHAKGYDRESTYERGLMYASAARTKQEEEERKSRQKDNKTRTIQSDEIAKAIKKEISLVKELQSAYDTLTKKGDSHANAIAKVQDLYGKTINLLNKDMDKFGLPKLDLSIIKGNNHNEILAFFEKLRDVLESKGLSNLERMEAVEGVVKEFRLKAETYNLDMITKGLNNELGKLKDEYDLAIELDANPELGGIFADMMGIDENQLKELPRNFNDVMNKLQSIIDSKLGSGRFDISKNLSKAALDEWLKLNSQGEENDDALAKMLNTFREYANKVRIDETKKQIDEWDKLLEKYAEYEYKRKVIREQYEKDMLTAQKNNASSDIKTAIQNRYESDMAASYMQEFKESPTWLAATGDLANLTHKAVGTLIDSLQEYKKSAKNLSPKQIQEINKALNKLYKQQRQSNPFHLIADAIDESKEQFNLYQIAINEAERRLDSLLLKASKNQSATKEETEEIKRQREELERLKKEQKEIAKTPAESIVKGINNAISMAKEATGAFSDMAEALGGEKMTEAAQNITNVVGILEKAGQGASVGAQFGTWGAIIGAVASGLAAVVTTYANKWSGNEGIDRGINDSILRVKVLENAYKSLEQTVKDAYGTGETAAQRLVIANKELQLNELKRQLQLEQERKSKNKDNQKIEDLKGQIIDLENEINNSAKDIANNLLDISSVGDAAEQLVSSMISAFKQGEDYMKVFDESFESMIDNMIMKAIVSNVIGERIQQMFDKVKTMATERADKEVLNATDIFSNISWGLDNAYSDTIEGWRDFLNERLYSGKYKISDADKKEYENALAKLNEIFASKVEVTPADVDSIRNQVDGWKDDVKAEFEAWMDAFGISFGQDKETDGTNLSALQQGIQGITEDTAGAIEAYMNGVSQQVYLQSGLLAQISETILGFDLDIQVATIGQMLLQLQQSYQVQQSIETILQNVLNPSGRAFSVELIS